MADVRRVVGYLLLALWLLFVVPAAIGDADVDEDEAGLSSISVVRTMLVALPVLGFILLASSWGKRKGKKEEAVVGPPRGR